MYIHTYIHIIYTHVCIHLLYIHIHSNIMQCRVFCILVHDHLFHLCLHPRFCCCYFLLQRERPTSVFSFTLRFELRSVFGLPELSVGVAVAVNPYFVAAALKQKKKKKSFRSVVGRVCGRMS